MGEHMSDKRYIWTLIVGAIIAVIILGIIAEAVK